MGNGAAGRGLVALAYGVLPCLCGYRKQSRTSTGKQCLHDVDWPLREVETCFPLPAVRQTLFNLEPQHNLRSVFSGHANRLGLSTQHANLQKDV
jgi:hypothetical protein